MDRIQAASLELSEGICVGAGVWNTEYYNVCNLQMPFSLNSYDKKAAKVTCSKVKQVLVRVIKIGPDNRNSPFWEYF